MDTTSVILAFGTLLTTVVGVVTAVNSAKLTALERTVTILQAENKRLADRVQALENENEELRDENARLRNGKGKW